MKSNESPKTLTPFRLLRRDDGAYARKSAGGDEVLVSKQKNGKWEVYHTGSSEALGLWRDSPKPSKVNRGGLLSLFGFRKVEKEAPSRRIDPRDVREIYFLENDIQGKEVYRNVSLPSPPQFKPWRARHYNVVMRIDPSQQEIESRATIRGQALEALEHIPFDLASFPGSVAIIDSLGATPSFYRTEDGFAVATPVPSGQDFELEVHFRGQPQPVSHPGVPADLGWLSNPISTITFNGAARSSSWLPGDDNPGNKATYDFTIEVPPNYFAVANGELVGETYLDNGFRRFCYRSRYPMASYLASVNTFDEKVFTRQEIAPNFEVVFPKDMEEKVRSEFCNHSHMMAFLEERLGKYPFDVYGAIVTSLPVDTYRTRFTDGENTYEADSKFEVAFEAQTRPIFQAESITGNGDFEPTIIHEMAHQWFGNAVTNATESDVWVNEAFPSYSGWLWVEEVTGGDALEREMQALYDTVKNHRFSDTMARPERDKLFSQENYARMTLSMHALRLRLGDGSFYRTLAGVMSAHKYQSVTVDTVARTINALNGNALEEFLHAWLYEKKIPEFPIRRHRLFR